MKIKNLLKIMAGICVSAILFSCQGNLVPQDTLEVVPNGGLTFNATGNASVSFVVTTSAEDWDFTAPEWAGAVKVDDEMLTITVADNTAATNRTGRLIFTAGNANPVKINLVQYAATVVAVEAEATLADESGATEVRGSVFTTAPVYTAKVKATIAKAVDADLNITLVPDMEYAPEYSYLHENLACECLAAEKVGKCVVTIPAGATESEVAEVAIDLTDVAAQVNCVVSLVPDQATLPSGVEFTFGGDRVTYCIVKRLPKDIKNVVYLEVNNTNPLNLLEYKLADGSPFFDVVILFAANVNYDAENDLVFLFNNPNVQALLNETEVYIQPLRAAGMEVQLGLLPNHTPAGLVNLTEAGAKMFASDVARACRDYKLDGASMDEEYSSGSASTSLIGNPSAQKAAYLCYELKQQMKELCSWPTQVSVFDFGWYWTDSFTYNGQTIDISEAVDGVYANYGSIGTLHGSMTKKNVSGKSIECNLGRNRTMSESEARTMKENGYGWCMWFAFHPQVGGGLTNNAPSCDPLIKAAAKGMYDQELQEPRYYYTKLGEGKYDPTRRERTW